MFTGCRPLSGTRPSKRDCLLATFLHKYSNGESVQGKIQQLQCTHSTRDMPRLYSPEPPVMQYAMLTEKTAKSKHAFCITSSAIELWRSFPLLPSRPRGVGPKPTVSHKPQASHPAELWPKPGTQGETLQRFSVEEYCASNLSLWHVVCSTLAVKLLCIEALPGLCMYCVAKHLRTCTPRVSEASIRDPF